MDGLHVVLAFLGVISCRDTCSSLLLEVTVKHGDNITLYCDSKVLTGVYIVWFRNCSHENQPSLVLSIKEISIKQYSPYDGSCDVSQLSPRYSFVRNFSSDSYDLMITNTTHSDEGLYYCGTQEMKVEKKQTITQKEIYRYGNILTRLTVNSSRPDLDLNPTLQHHDVCWKLLFILLSTFSCLFLLSLFLAYLLCQKSANKSQGYVEKCDTRIREETQGEDVCYAALEIHQAKRKSKKKDFSALSTVKYKPGVMDSN